MHIDMHKLYLHFIIILICIVLIYVAIYINVYQQCFLHILPPFPLAVHFRVSFGLLNNLPPSAEADCLVSEQFSFYGLRFLASRPTPNPQPGGPWYPSPSGAYPLTCPAWVTLPVATLPPA
jgi:hypothetical protein